MCVTDVTTVSALCDCDSGLNEITHALSRNMYLTAVTDRGLLGCLGEKGGREGRKVEVMGNGHISALSQLCKHCS